MSHTHTHTHVPKSNFVTVSYSTHRCRAILGPDKASQNRMNFLDMFRLEK